MPPENGDQDGKGAPGTGDDGQQKNAGKGGNGHDPSPDLNALAQGMQTLAQSMASLQDSQGQITETLAALQKGKGDEDDDDDGGGSDVARHGEAPVTSRAQ